LRATRPTMFAIIAVALTITLSACGFRPLYGTPSGAAQSTAAELNQIYVHQINDSTSRTGHMVYQKLEQALRQSGTGIDRNSAPKYQLLMRIDQQEEGVAIEPDETLTRLNIRLVATYELRDIANNVLTKGTSQAIGTYNVVANQYASHIGKQDAAERASTILVADITTRLVSYFDGNRP